MTRRNEAESIQLEDAFLRLCEAFDDMTSCFGKEFQTDNNRLMVKLLRRMIGIEFVFTRSELGGVRNALYCRIYPNKAVQLYYLLPELFVELDVDEYRSCFFAEIETEERLACCFRQLTALLAQHLSTIEAAAQRGALPWKPEAAGADTLEHWMAFDCQRKERDGVVLYSYTLAPAYRALLCGRQEKAVRLLEQYGRKGRSFAYQDRLCAYLKRCGAGFQPMPEECNAVQAELRLRKRIVSITLGGFGILLALFALVFFLLRSVFLLWFTKGCAAYFAFPWYGAFLLASLPAFFGAFALRKRLGLLLSRKHGAAINRFDEMKNSRKMDSVWIAFVVSCLLSLFFFAQFYGNTVRVYEDRLDYAVRDHVLQREVIRFSDIETVCHVHARYNEYGDRIEQASCVIVTNDKRVFDLYGSATEAQCEEKLFPLLAAWNVRHAEADTVQDYFEDSQQ